MAYVVLVPVAFVFGIIMIWIVGYDRSLFVMGKFELVILFIGFVLYGIGVYRNCAVTKIYEKYDEMQYDRLQYAETENDEDKQGYEIEGEIKEIKENTYGYTITLRADEGLVYVYTDSTLCGLLTEAYNHRTMINDAEEEYIESFVACLYGKEVAVCGEIIPMERARNFGNYDEYKVLRSKGVLVKMSAESMYLFGGKEEEGECLKETYNVQEIELSDEMKKLTISGRICKMKNYLRKILNNIVPEKEYGILSAMVLGDNTDLDKNIKELYSLSGISHIITISGLHISLIGMGLYKLLRRKMRYVSSATISLGIMTLFLVFIGNPISATRAVIMFFVHIFADLYGRKYDVLSALSLAAIIILMDNPYYLLNASFQLSFIAIIAVSVSAPIVTSLFFRDEEDDAKDKKKEVNKNENRKNTLEKSGRYMLITGVCNVSMYIGRILIFNIAMTITLMPINSYLFFRHSTYSPLSNMIVVPLVGLVLGMTLLGMISAIFIPALGTFFVGTGVYLLEFFTWLSEKIVELPYANVITGKISLLEVILCYVILTIGLMRAWKMTENIKKFWRYVELFLLLIIFLFLVFREKIDRFTVSFLDVGQGACIYIKSDEGNDYLIDGGSSDERNVGEYRIESFLEARKIEKLEYVFVTHCDTDHISGISEIIERENISIDNLVLPDISVNARDEKYLKLVELAKLQGIEVIYMKSGDKLKDGQMMLSCINPSGEDEVNKASAKVVTTDINDASLVFVLEYKELSVVLTGDIGKEVEKQILDDLELMLLKSGEKSDTYQKIVVYDVAHHGSANSNSDEFIHLITPSISVVSCGKDNSYGHPAKEVLERLKDVGSEIWCTFESGQIEIYEGEEGMMVKGFVDD